MLHPLKVSIADSPIPSQGLDGVSLRIALTDGQSSSSYECDGCGHHASFHNMENKTEDEIRKRWEIEAKEKAELDDEAQQRPKKRTRAIEYSKEGEDAEWVSAAMADLLQETRSKSKASAVPKKRTTRLAGTRAKNKISEIVDDDAVVELD